MKYYPLLLTALLGALTLQPARAQQGADEPGPGRAPAWALRTNLLSWATTTPSLGVEAALAPKWTLDLQGAYQPWTFKNDKKLHFWLAQPEVKYWFCEKFEGHHMGLHLHGAQFYGGLGHQIFDGGLAGAGLSYGYAWILSPHWNLDAQLGAGYARLWFKQSDRLPCMKCYDRKARNYWGLTKVALSVAYVF